MFSCDSLSLSTKASSVLAAFSVYIYNYTDQSKMISSNILISATAMLAMICSAAPARSSSVTPGTQACNKTFANRSCPAGVVDMQYRARVCAADVDSVADIAGHVHDSVRMTVVECANAYAHMKHSTTATADAMLALGITSCFNNGQMDNLQCVCPTGFYGFQCENAV